MDIGDFIDKYCEGRKEFSDDLWRLEQSRYRKTIREVEQNITDSIQRFGRIILGSTVVISIVIIIVFLMSKHL